MKNKILTVGLILMLGGMLALLTGCGEQANPVETAQSVVKNNGELARAENAKRMSEIGEAKDDAQMEVSSLLNEFYAESALATGNLSNTAKEYITENLKNGKTASDGKYIIVIDGQIVVYEDSTMQNEIVSGTLDSEGKVTWQETNQTYNETPTETVLRNQEQAVVDSNNLSQAEIQAFNSQFEAYAGTSVRGSNVRLLMSKIQQNNSMEEDRNIEIIGVTRSEVNSAKTYNVKFNYDSKGLINQAIINEN